MSDHKLSVLMPVYNERYHVEQAMEEVLAAPLPGGVDRELVVVDDGSTDGTAAVLAQRPRLHVVRHPRNRGYGAALLSAFEFALRGGYDVLVTIDCDGQHEPQRIPDFVRTCLDQEADIVSGSRYLRQFAGDSQPPEDRRRINRILTEEINRCLGLKLTDAFCGFKAYRVPMLAKFEITDPGYAMPLELWVQAAALGLKIVELPVPLIYLEEARSFGGELDDAATRLRHYYDVLDRSIAAAEAAGWRPRQHAPASPCPV
jgi:dolichol-phosphate mannosyltransferase